MIRWLSYGARWVRFAIRWLLALAYRILLLFCSRGALFVLPVVGALALFEYRASLHDALTRYVLLELRPGHVPGTVALDVLLAVSLALAMIAHKLLTRRLTVSSYLLVAMPLIATIVALQYRPALHAELVAAVRSYPLREIPKPWALDTILVALLVLAEVLYQEFWYVLWVVLNTLPPVNWPLPPVPPLRVKTRPIVSVAVKMAVPKLPKRRGRLRLART